MKIIKQCNCKINLNLKIVGVKDGYHLLESVFCPISICDEIEVFVSEVDTVIGMDIPQEKNIVFKTIKKFKEKFSIKTGITVKINKRIPMQAGLGGGSSDAAFTIIALNELLDLRLPVEEMIEFSKEIGSDVPFFIVNKPSFVEGRGEIITPLKNFKKVYGILAFDDVFMSTKEVFEKYDRLEDKEVSQYNDLEQAVLLMSGGDKIGRCKEVLKSEGCYNVAMSGAGGSVFGLCKKEEVDEIYKRVKRKLKNVWKFESI